jgi:hypothetical protein
MVKKCQGEKALHPLTAQAQAKWDCSTAAMPGIAEENLLLLTVLIRGQET